MKYTPTHFIQFYCYFIIKLLFSFTCPIICFVCNQILLFNLIHCFPIELVCTNQMTMSYYYNIELI